MNKVEAVESSQTPSKAVHYGLWVAQVLLALMFGMAGAMKSFTPIGELSKSLPWVAESPAALVRFIGLSELAGALGLILPSVTRVRPRLTALAAVGLVLVMALASLFHLSRGEAKAVPVNFVLGGLAAFVAWGRSKKAPIAHR
ncbi:putative integral membrane protein [Labilithrix luteola]|uniref:Putative integral membrane protein n=1 Tax=Labilithrix luteola TaxID=1391654 RepID=A0A0K1QB50_9BACT|nr:DoxX family protein [Labilithrix luteola]AKV02640.1 putative integral membrane protein [Labilithrix luteola]